MGEENPRLRTDIQMGRGQAQGKDVIVVRDPTGIIEHPVALDPAVASIMAMLDGTRSVRDIQYELMRRQGGVLVTSESIQRVIDHLDQAFLLDNERYHRALQQLATAYAAEPIRRAVHAGEGYPDSAKDLHEYLDSILAKAEGKAPAKGDGIVGLAAPHIDIRVGERVYANAYRLLAGAQPERVILLGIMHRSDDALFSISRKGYETPFGVTETDLDLVARLCDAGESVLSDHDMAHRTEHSIEFQVVFLQHILGRPDIRIVPILCGGVSHMLDQGKRLSELPGMAAFLSAMREAVEDKGRKTLLVAGVDLSHVGPKFGDRMSARAIVDESEKHDRALLDALCKLDAKAFWAESRRVGDRYNVCGFPALACMTEVLGGCRGDLLDYEVWHEEPTRSAVSFAAVAFTSV